MTEEGSSTSGSKPPSAAAREVGVALGTVGDEAGGNYCVRSSRHRRLLLFASSRSRCFNRFFAA